MIYIETDEQYTARVTKIKLESIHCALQELQQEFNIPNDHEHLENAFKFTEDLREKYLKEQDNE
tara:strand:+ start:256 stop:447 length:192 start_codon:yes stop_codon:yes gene_type:complete